MAAIEAEIVSLETDRNATRRARLEAVLGAVEAAEWAGLADHMRSALEPGGPND